MPELAESIVVAGDEDLVLQAEALVRDYCRWHIAPEREETFTLDGSGTCVQLLPTLRLTAVTSVTNDGDNVALDDVEWSEAGILRRPVRWSCKFRGVTVVATHGFSSVPADVTGVVQAVAQRMKGNPTGAQSWNRGPFGESYAPDFLATEKAVLDRYKLPPRP